MGFIVQSISKRAGEPPYRITKATKKDALDAAIGLLAQGMEDVTITDEKGQVHSTSEFVDFIDGCSAARRYRRREGARTRRCGLARGH
jgi:hypothetical protein